jgi:hypothetical protein
MMIASPNVSICYKHDFGAWAGRLRQFDKPQQQG